MAVSNYLNVVWGVKDNGFEADAKKKLGFFSSVKNSLASISELMTSTFTDMGGTLMTEYEHTLQTTRKEVGKMAANFGLAGKAVHQITKDAQSMSNATGISVQDTADALFQFNKANKEFTGIGINSATELAKFTEVTKIPAEQMRLNVTTMGKRLNLMPDDIKAVMNSFISAGGAVGDVQKTMATMPEFLEEMIRLNQMSGSPLNAEALKNVAAQYTDIAALAANALGMGSDASLKFAQDLTNAVTKTKQGFIDISQGITTELPEMAVALAKSTSNIEGTFEMMTQGPEQFLTGFSTILKDLENVGMKTPEILTFMRGQLKGAVSEQTVDNLFMLAQTDKLDEKIAEIRKKAAESKGASGLVGAFNEGRSYDSLVGLWKSQLEATIRQGHKFSDIYVKNIGPALRGFGKDLVTLSKDKNSPMGMVINKMNEIHQLGTKGLLPEHLRTDLTKMDVLGGMFESVSKALKGLGVDLNMLAGGPWSILFAGVKAIMGLFNLELIHNKGNIGKAIRSTIFDVVEGLDSAVDWVDSFISNIATELEKQGGSLSWAFTGVFSKIGKLWADKIKPILVKVLTPVGEWLMQTLTPFLEKAVNRLGQMLADAAIIGFRQIPGMSTLFDLRTSGEKAQVSADKAIIEVANMKQLFPNGDAVLAKSMALEEALRNPRDYDSSQKIIERIEQLIVKMEDDRKEKAETDKALLEFQKEKIAHQRAQTKALKHIAGSNSSTSDVNPPSSEVSNQRIW